MGGHTKLGKPLPVKDLPNLAEKKTIRRAGNRSSTNNVRYKAANVLGLLGLLERGAC